MNILKQHTPSKDTRPEREVAFFSLISTRVYSADNPKDGVFLIQNYNTKLWN